MPTAFSPPAADRPEDVPAEEPDAPGEHPDPEPGDGGSTDPGSIPDPADVPPGRHPDPDPDEL